MRSKILSRISLLEKEAKNSRKKKISVKLSKDVTRQELDFYTKSQDILVIIDV